MTVQKFCFRFHNVTLPKNTPCSECAKLIFRYLIDFGRYNQELRTKQPLTEFDIKELSRGKATPEEFGSVFEEEIVGGYERKRPAVILLKRLDK